MGRMGLFCTASRLVIHTNVVAVWRHSESPWLAAGEWFECVAHLVSSVTLWLPTLPLALPLDDSQLEVVVVATGLFSLLLLLAASLEWPCFRKEFSRSFLNFRLSFGVVLAVWLGLFLQGRILEEMSSGPTFEVMRELAGATVV